MLRNLPESQSGARGDRPCGLPERPNPRSRPGGAWTPWDPLAAPLRQYIALAPKTLEAEPFFLIPSLFRRCRHLNIGAVRRPCPGTLPEGGSTSGNISNAMDGSRMTRE